MAKNAEQFPELSERICTTKNAIYREYAGARITEGWQRLVKITASKVIEGKS